MIVVYEYLSLPRNYAINNKTATWSGPFQCEYEDFLNFFKHRHQGIVQIKVKVPNKNIVDKDNNIKNLMYLWSNTKGWYEKAVALQ